MPEIWGNLRKTELLPTRYCEAGYAPGTSQLTFFNKKLLKYNLQFKVPE